MSIRPLPSELRRIVETELNEDPERREADLKHILEWINTQPHLKCRTDEQWLLTFMRCCKFNLSKTKEKLDLYCTVRTLAPEFFDNRDPLLPEIQEYLKRGLSLPLPNPDVTPDHITFARVGSADPEKINVTTIVKVNLMALDILLNEDDTIVAGSNVIVDLQNLPSKYITQATPSMIKKAVTCMQDAYPVRVKDIHLINVPSHFEMFYKVLKMFLSKKVKDRIHFYTGSSFTNILNFIPSVILPKQYGGLGDLDEMAAEWKLKVESYRDWFLEDAIYGSDESKRPGKNKTGKEVLDESTTTSSLAED